MYGVKEKPVNQNKKFSKCLVVGGEPAIFFFKYFLGGKIKIPTLCHTSVSTYARSFVLVEYVSKCLVVGGEPPIFFFIYVLGG